MNPQTIKIFGRHTSYNVQKVLWFVDELELEYTHIQAGGRYGGNDTPDFLALNPNGKVPVLCDGDRVIWESNTIVRYLAESYSSQQWISTEPYRRSLVERWMDWSIDTFEQAFLGVFWGYYRTPPDQRDLSAIEKAVVTCEACLSLLSTQLGERRFLLGERPTLADIATGVFLHRLISIDLEVKQPDNIDTWYQTLGQRPGYKKWVMSDFSELQGRLAY